jgi:energy-converting hydrogenase A subunit M
VKDESVREDSIEEDPVEDESVREDSIEEDPVEDKSVEDNNMINSSENDEELLRTMKMRIIKSYRWQVDIVETFSKELGITGEELEEIFIKRLDMSSLEAIQPRFESSRHYCIKERVHADLRLCWLSDIMNILSEDETQQIKNKIAGEILKGGKSYDDAIKDGKKELLEYLMR